MNFQPLGKRALVKVQEEAKKTASGIIIPDSASKEKPQKGEVVAVSNEVDELKVGQVVIFAKYSGSEIILNDEKYLVLNYEDILGYIK